MLVRIFKTNQVYIFAFLPLLLIALRWPALLTDAPFSPAGQLPFLTNLFAWLSLHPIFSLLMGITAILYQAYLIALICNENRLVTYSSNLSAFILVIMYSIFAPQNWFSPVIFSNVFTVLALRRILEIYQQGDIKGTLFRSGIYISLASILFLPASFMIFIVFYDLGIVRKFQWREYIIPVVGFLTPLVYLWFAYFMLDESDIFFNYFIEPKSFLTILEFHFWNWFPAGIALVITLASFFYLFASINRRTVRQNNLFKVVIFTFLVMLLLSFIFSKDFMSASSLMWPALSIIVSYFIMNIERRWLQEGLIYILLICIIARDFLHLSINT